jgi:hypothetical protein
MARASLPPLDKIDPAQAWQPWEPDARTPFDASWAAHLYRRAAFGASRQTLHAAVTRGLPATLELLLGGAEQAEGLHAFLMRQGERVARTGVRDLRSWWVYCMLNSGHPLREKLTLFWHNHFATSNTKVNNAGMMCTQNRLLRENALGKFGPFLLAISKDPAMLVWLDSNANIKGKPNENYAREVMELFSLGVGNYSEHDIQEAARAFTGWHTNGAAFEFNPHFHDDGTKEVLGQKGNFNGDDIVRIILEQKVAARFLVGKLYRFFISETHTPPPALIEPLADAFRTSDYDIALVVRTMLSSRLFFSEHAFRQKIKSPVEFVLGAAQATVKGSIPPAPLVPWIDRMGQQLFAPPNVKGWREGRDWLNTSTMVARQNFAQALAMGTLWRGGRASSRQVFIPPPPPVAGDKGRSLPEEPPPASQFDPARLLGEARGSRPEEVVDTLLHAYVPGGVSPPRRLKLLQFVREGKPAGPALKRRAREAVHAILTMPESQLS